jgi:hypothetical protein
MGIALVGVPLRVSSWAVVSSYLLFSTTTYPLAQLLRAPN